MPRPFRSLLFAVALLAAWMPLQAQTPAVEAVRAALRDQAPQWNATAADVAETVVTDTYTSQHTGVTHVYLRQALGGVAIVNAPVSGHVTRTGQVVGLHARLVGNVAAQRRSAATPSLDAAAALAAAARHLGLDGQAGALTERRASPAQNAVFGGGSLSLEPIPAQLVYVATEAQGLRLAWDLSLYQPDQRHWWSVRIDAETGQLLERNDWVVQCLASEEGAAHDHRAHRHVRVPVAQAFQPSRAPLAPAAASASGTYRVVPLPFESPNHGPIGLVTNAADPVASPRGWHDDGVGTYTITRGNNVWAYEDRANTDAPGFSPDGGPGLTFDFPFEDAAPPLAYESFIITNLFYWNNVFHDVLHYYGFDEAGGNFQRTNFSGQGRANDAVRAEAQDGSGTNNANMAVPPDGSPGRMQMYLWNFASFEITEPAEIAGPYGAAGSAFGPQAPPTGLVAAVVPVLDNTGSIRGCNPIPNTGELAGKIALIERGDCFFAVKVRNAQAAGAAGVIVYNNAQQLDPEALVNMGLPAGDGGGDIAIPSTFVARSTGTTMADLANFGVPVTVSLVGGQRDSGLDNGIILHEYTHGVSIRLTGGPSNSNCLSNDEQAGEGWSDWYGLMLTMTASDVATQKRGIGTYASYEPTDGPGIRPAPYSTDRSINNLTYAAVANPNISMPHGIGTVWATMLWDMTWLLIDRYGFDPNLKTGTGGNNIALQLVTDGLKLQPCNPGFVDGRDAILLADQLAYGGANEDLIWRAFAGRGLGVNASQGSAASRADGVQDFTLPAGVATEDGTTVLPEGYRLSGVYPNPFHPAGQFTLEVARPETVRIALYDLLGRSVQVVHDGPLLAGTRHAFTLRGAGLASGAYVLRIAGETFATSERVTLIR